MKPILPYEIALYTDYLKQTPINVERAISLLVGVNVLQSSPFPLNMTVNEFRRIVGVPAPHPDERGKAMLLDPDIVKADDVEVTKDMLLAARQNLEDNNKGRLAELKQQYAELYDATGG